MREVVELSGWTTGSSLAFVLSHTSGSGVRWVESWGYARDGLATPLLEIEWSHLSPAWPPLAPAYAPQQPPPPPSAPPPAPPPPLPPTPIDYPPALPPPSVPPPICRRYPCAYPICFPPTCETSNMVSPADDAPRLFRATLLSAQLHADPATGGDAGGGSTAELRFALEYTCCVPGGVEIAIEGHAVCPCAWTRLGASSLSEQQGTSELVSITVQTAGLQTLVATSVSAVTSDVFGVNVSGGGSNGVPVSWADGGPLSATVSWSVEISQLGMCVDNRQPHIHSMFSRWSPCRITVANTEAFPWHVAESPQLPPPALPPPPPSPPPSVPPFAPGEEVGTYVTATFTLAGTLEDFGSGASFQARARRLRVATFGPHRRIDAPQGHPHPLTPTRSRPPAHAHPLTPTRPRAPAHAHPPTRTRPRAPAIQIASVSPPPLAAQAALERELSQFGVASRRIELSSITSGSIR